MTRHPGAEWLALSDDAAKETALSCKDACPKKLACGHRCSKTCHSGPCSSVADCKKKVVYRCKCKRQKKEVACSRKTPDDAHVPCTDACAKPADTAAEEAEETPSPEVSGSVAASVSLLHSTPHVPAHVHFLGRLGIVWSPTSRLHRNACVCVPCLERRGP